MQIPKLPSVQLFASNLGPLGVPRTCRQAMPPCCFASASSTCCMCLHGALQLAQKNSTACIRHNINHKWRCDSTPVISCAIWL